jgi:hypothetical protein
MFSALVTLHFGVVIVHNPSYKMMEDIPNVVYSLKECSIDFPLVPLYHVTSYFFSLTLIVKLITKGGFLCHRKYVIGFPFERRSWLNTFNDI